jgi:hypothetical protein
MLSDVEYEKRYSTAALPYGTGVPAICVEMLSDFVISTKKSF